MRAGKSNDGWTHFWFVNIGSVGIKSSGLGVFLLPSFTWVLPLYGARSLGIAHYTFVHWISHALLQGGQLEFGVLYFVVPDSGPWFIGLRYVLSLSR